MATTRKTTARGAAHLGRLELLVLLGGPHLGLAPHLLGVGDLVALGVSLRLPRASPPARSPSFPRLRLVSALRSQQAIGGARLALARFVSAAFILAASCSAASRAKASSSAFLSARTRAEALRATVFQPLETLARRLSSVSASASFTSKTAARMRSLSRRDRIEVISSVSSCDLILYRKSKQTKRICV